MATLFLMSEPHVLMLSNSLFVITTLPPYAFISIRLLNSYWKLVNVTVYSNHHWISLLTSSVRVGGLVSIVFGLKSNVNRPAPIPCVIRHSSVLHKDLRNLENLTDL